MALIKWNRGGVPSMNEMIENFFNTEVGDILSERGSLPSVNVKESKDDYRLEVAAPGLSKNDFNLQIDNNILTISAEKEEKQEKKEEAYNRKEFSYTSFSRSFTLPDVVEHDKIEANYRDGILHICIPKKEESKVKASKRIDIK